MTLVIEDNDKEYQKWLGGNSEGYILSLKQNRTIGYISLHRSTCYHISRYDKRHLEGAFTERGYIKICSNKIRNLKKWINNNLEDNAEITITCKHCKPLESKKNKKEILKEKTKKLVEKAFLSFSKGHRPENYRKPHSWYVTDNNGIAYPAKAIWALATNKKLSEFHTEEALAELAHLSFSLIDEKLIFDQDKFQNQVDKALADTGKSRKKRLKKARKTPQVTYIQVKSYTRNPDVVAEVLIRAKGYCEECESEAPFLRKKDDTPYLEVHHIKLLSKGGKDTVKNAIALCPNCHRKSHYG